MKRTSHFPKQSKRKRNADDQESSTEETKSGVTNEVSRSHQSYSANDDPTLLGYSDNITAACFATNAESSRQNMLTDREKREKRLLSNRLSARRSRERHKVEVAHLEDQARQLSQLIKTLQNENATLREYVDKRKNQNAPQVSDSRLSLVDLATLLQQPTGSSPMDILLRAQQQESNQLLQSMTNRNQQHHPLYHSLASSIPNSAFSTALVTQPATALPINLFAGPPIPVSIRHLLDSSTPWETSTTSSTSAKSRASKRHASRQSDQSQESSSSDEDEA